MSEGFKKEKLNITIDFDGIDDVIKHYKKLKKYQKSSIYTIKSLDGTEEIISKLIKENTENMI